MESTISPDLRDKLDDSTVADEFDRAYERAKREGDTSLSGVLAPLTPEMREEFDRRHEELLSESEVGCEGPGYWRALLDQACRSHANWSPDDEEAARRHVIDSIDKWRASERAWLHDKEFGRLIYAAVSLAALESAGAIREEIARAPAAALVHVAQLHRERLDREIAAAERPAPAPNDPLREFYDIGQAHLRSLRWRLVRACSPGRVPVILGGRDRCLGPFSAVREGRVWVGLLGPWWGDLE
jgi:hypothetical protein